MTVLEHITAVGVTLEVPSLKRYQVVNVAFVNNAGLDDVVQFDVKFLCTKAGNEELSELFNTFCKEEHCPNDTVSGITVVYSADFWRSIKNYKEF